MSLCWKAHERVSKIPKETNYSKMQSILLVILKVATIKIMVNSREMNLRWLQRSAENQIKPKRVSNVFEIFYIRFLGFNKRKELELIKRD